MNEDENLNDDTMQFCRDLVVKTPLTEGYVFYLYNALKDSGIVKSIGIKSVLIGCAALMLHGVRVDSVIILLKNLRPSQYESAFMVKQIES